MAVLGSVADGSWVLLVFAAVLYLVMYIWNYGAKLKYETEVKQKLSMDLLMELGCNLGTVRAPGIGLLYNELVRGVPAIFGHFLTTMPAIHSMIIFVCIKCVPVPVVPQNERFLFRRVCPKSYHMFRCIASPFVLTATMRKSYEVASMAVSQKWPILLYGPVGAGKTAIINKLAQIGGNRALARALYYHGQGQCFYDHGKPTVDVVERFSTMAKPEDGEVGK